MLPSVDTYIHEEIDKKMRLILENRYIIEEILSEIQPKVASNFMRAYAGNKNDGSMANKREVPIVYTLPQDKHTQQGAIYIGLKQGEETDPSLGSVEDSYAYKQEGASRQENVEILEEIGGPKPRLYIQVDDPIIEFNFVENLIFSTVDNVNIDKENGRIYFNHDQDLLNLIAQTKQDAEDAGKKYYSGFHVHYTKKMYKWEKVDGTWEKVVDRDQGLKKGFSARESYSIVAISTNMDTVRCLDLIIKAIMIMMRENPAEQNNTLLQKLAFGQIEEIPVGTETSPLLLYGRETVVSYTSSYSLDVPLMQRLKQIIIDKRLVQDLNPKEVAEDGRD